MKAIVVTERGHVIYDIENIGKFFDIVGHTDDLSKERKQGQLVHRRELDNQPVLKDFIGPMWDGDKLRYESQGIYDILSR